MCLAADCSAPFHRLSNKRQCRGLSRLQLELCSEPCLLASGPRAAGLCFLIYAIKLSHIYVYRNVSNFFCFIFSFSDRRYSFIADIFIYLPFDFNPLNPELNPICYLLALLGAHHFLHVGRLRVKLLTFRRLMSYIYIYGAPILDVSRSYTTTQHSR